MPTKNNNNITEVIGGVEFVFQTGIGGKEEKRNTKYTPTVIKRAYALLRHNDYTVPDISKKIGIAEDTYYHWLRQPEKYIGFKDLLKKCEEERLAKLKIVARNSIMKKAEGWKTKEKTISKGTNAKGIPFENETITEKILVPDTALLTWIAENLESDIFKNRQEVRHTGFVGTANIEVESNKLKGLGVDKLRALMTIAQDVEKINNPEKID